MFGGGQFDLPNSVGVFGFTLYFYGIIIALGLALATAYALRSRDRFGLTQDNIFDLLIFGVPAGIVGARLYYVIFNASDYFGPGKWLNIIRLREGGLAVYGGIIFASATVVIYSKVKKIPVGGILDMLGLGLPIGQSVGRWGNFFNREAFGSATDLPWRMGLTPPGGSTVFVHPTFLYESLWNAAGFVILHHFLKRHRRYSGQVFLLYLVWYGLGRFMIEGLRADSLYIPRSDIRISQLLSAVIFVAATGLLCYNRFHGRTLAELTSSSPATQDDDDDWIPECGEIEANGDDDDVEADPDPDPNGDPDPDDDGADITTQPMRADSPEIKEDSCNG
jgi:phosphatidylglycerol:prolipoprotein diacylglycerol transferase